MRRASGRLRRADGFSLVELIVVMGIMALILGPIINTMTASMNAEASQLNVVVAQEQARLALQRMRKDIHCAHAVGNPETNSSGGQTIVLTETNTTGVAECPGLIQQNASAIEWCTIPVTGVSNDYSLYRDNNANDTCDSADSTFQVGYITEADLWSVPTCTGGEYPTVAVSLPVDVDPGSHITGTYALADQIALRNASTCS